MADPRQAQVQASSEPGGSSIDAVPQAVVIDPSKTKMALGVVPPGPDRPKEPTSGVPVAVAHDASRTRMAVGAVLPPDPNRTDAQATGPVLGAEAITTPESTPVPRPSRRAGNPRVTRPAWIAAALAGDDRPTTHAVALGPGDQVPGTRYRIHRWLGDGGMGVVYEAEHLDLGRRAALKILRRELCKDPAVTRLFRDEARIVSQIGAESIVQVYDFAELPDGRLMFTMELLRGPTLADVIREGPMDPGRAIAILRQACKGLAAAHAASVIHRDVKPDNIVLEARRGRNDVVKLLDFGIAAVTSAADSSAGAAAGTPYYLAPEIIAGLPSDAHVDVYALGCTAYEMLVGHPPFRGESIEDILHKHLDETPIPASKAGPKGQIPPALSAVVQRCLAKRPQERYPDMAELEAALCEAQIAAGFHTTWDDLPLPEIDPERRARLLADMPDPVTRWLSRRGHWMWRSVAALALATAMGLAAYVYLRPATVVQEIDAVDMLMTAARAAAAKSYFVYPPPENPSQPTAYSRVLELEHLEDDIGSAARESAAILRQEFASTLVRLGDEYWDRDGGKPFAVDYYAAALVFDPDDERAADRASLTPGQLVALKDKAQSLSFTEDELLAAEPLIALAEPEPERRLEKLAKVRSKRRARAASTDSELERLGQEIGATTPSSSRAADDQSGSNAASSAPLPDTTAAEADDKPKAAASANHGSPADEAWRRDPKIARDLVAQAREAQGAGRLDAARRLFENALGHDPSNAAAAMGLSDVWFHQGQYAKAVSYGQKAVRLAPQNAEYRIHLGDAHFKAFQYEAAKAQYARAGVLGHGQAAARLAKVEQKIIAP